MNLFRKSPSPAPPAPRSEVHAVSPSIAPDASSPAVAALTKADEIVRLMAERRERHRKGW